MAIPQERMRVTAPGAAVTTTEGIRISWGGVWSGSLVGFGVLILLSSLGLAIGVSATDITSASGAKGLGIGAAIWSFLSLLISLFVGAMLASRVGMVWDRMAGMIHGALVWVLAVFGIMYLAMAGISFGTSAIFSLLGGATRAVSGAVGAGAASLGNLSSGDVDQILARLSDPQTVDTVAAATGMSRDQARSALADIRARVEAARNDPAQAAAEARQGAQQLMSQAGQAMAQAAETAQSVASATSWYTFGVLVISAAVALWGGAFGTGRAQVRAQG